MLHSLLITLTTSCHQAETLPPPPLLDTAPLIRSLGGAYRERTDATRKLSAMGEAARPALERAKQDTDLEIARRAEMLLHWLDADRRKRAMAMVDAAFPGPLPWIDMAFIQPPDSEAREKLWHYYGNSYEAAEPRQGAPAEWGRFRSATRLLAYDMAEAGIPLVIIRAMVLELSQREEVWYRSFRGGK